MILAPIVIISVAVRDDGKRHSLLVRRDDSTKVLSSLHRDLADIEREGFHALCQRVGYSAIYALARAHPDVFAKYPLLLPPPPEYKHPHDVTMGLMARAGREDTGDYTQAIDALFERHPQELAGLAESWAMLRATLPHAKPE